MKSSEEPTISFKRYRQNETHWIGKVIEAEDRGRELELQLATANERIRILEETERIRTEKGPCRCLKARGKK